MRLTTPTLLAIAFAYTFLVQVDAFAQAMTEKELKTEIKEVTVFLQGAQVFETGTVTIPRGRSLIKVKNLSPYLDEKSIQVKADGDFTILAVNHKFNYLEELKKDVKVDSLQEVANTLSLMNSKDNARISVLNEKLSLLNENKKLGSQSTGTTILQLKQAIDFYDTEVTKILEEELKIKGILNQRKKELDQITHQLKELNEQKSLPTGEVDISVQAENSINARFNLTYLVGNAGWYPKYDIRVANVNSPLELTYKAEVYQHTGADWKNVKLKFSNSDPHQSGVLPRLPVWTLNYARYTNIKNPTYSLEYPIGKISGLVIDEAGTPIPGVNVIVKGTTVRTITDTHGHYELTLPTNASTLVFASIGFAHKEFPITSENMNVSLEEDNVQLGEVMVVGSGLKGKLAGLNIRGVSSIKKDYSIPIPTTIIENATTVEIEVATPYTLKSNSEKFQIELRKMELTANYEYYAVPKLDLEAFLVAQIINWDQYHLLEGEANLFFEDAYVGRTILEAKSLRDTLSISLGRDKSIVLAREKNTQFSRRKSFGSSTVETRGFKFTIRNNKSQTIKLTLFDHIPISVNSEITINPLELSSGLLEAKTGKVTWVLTLEAQQQKEISLQYEVKFPKSEKVILE